MNLIGQDYKRYLMFVEERDYAFADPPWNFEDNERPDFIRNQIVYERWNNQEGLKCLFNFLKVKYLFLWCPNALLKEVLSFDSKDYIYKTIITWVKLTSKGNLFYGLGNSFRNCTEQLLFYVHKGVKPLRSSLRNIIYEKSGKKTQKPKIGERELMTELIHKGFNEGIYLFSGENVSLFSDLDIDLVDIIFDKRKKV